MSSYYVRKIYRSINVVVWHFQPPENGFKWDCFLFYYIISPFYSWCCRKSFGFTSPWSWQAPKTCSMFMHWYLHPLVCKQSPDHVWLRHWHSCASTSANDRENSENNPSILPNSNAWYVWLVTYKTWQVKMKKYSKEYIRQNEIWWMKSYSVVIVAQVDRRRVQRTQRT